MNHIGPAQLSVWVEWISNAITELPADSVSRYDLSALRRSLIEKSGAEIKIEEKEAA